MLFAVAAAFPRTMSLPGIYKRLKGAVSTSERYTAPAMRAALSVGCIRFCLSGFQCFSSQRFLNRPSVTAHASGSHYKCRGEEQPDPEARRGHISSRSELCERIDRRISACLKIESVRGESHQTILD